MELIIILIHLCFENLFFRFGHYFMAEGLMDKQC